MQFRDRVKDTTTTTGTGNLTLSGSAPTGFQAWATAFATGSNMLPYTIEAVDGSGNPTGDWEVGFGTLSGATTFVRDRVLYSTNSNNAVNLSAGTKNVFCTWPSWLATQSFTAGMNEMSRLGAFTL